MAKKNPIPARLKEARIAAKYSQKTLGIASGIDEFAASARMNQYETGKHTPDFSILDNLAKVLKLPTAYFYANDDVLAELIKLYGQLTTNKRKELLKVAMQLSK